MSNAWKTGRQDRRYKSDDSRAGGKQGTSQIGYGRLNAGMAEGTSG
jgi:hypothetical protein